MLLYEYTSTLCTHTYLLLSIFVLHNQPGFVILQAPIETVRAPYDFL